jgi:hypothetical protein
MDLVSLISWSESSSSSPQNPFHHHACHESVFFFFQVKDCFFQGRSNVQKFQNWSVSLHDSLSSVLPSCILFKCCSQYHLFSQYYFKSSSTFSIYKRAFISSFDTLPRKVTRISGLRNLTGLLCAASIIFSSLYLITQVSLPNCKLGLLYVMTLFILFLKFILIFVIPFSLLAYRLMQSVLHLLI